MPIYEYQCQKCGFELELLQKVGSSAPNACPECHASSSMKRQVSAPQFKLKGTGWYETDFKTQKKEASTADTAHKKTDKKTDSE